MAPLARITRAHFSDSTRIQRANSAGSARDDVKTEPPERLARLRSAHSARRFRTQTSKSRSRACPPARESRSRRAIRAAAGRARRRSARPERVALRSSAVTASGVIFPALTCGSTAGMIANIASMLPASMSVTAGGKPRYGTCTSDDPGVALQKLHRQMRGAAAADRAVGKLSRLAPRMLDKRLEVGQAERRLDDEHLRRGREQRNRREVALGVVAKPLVEVLVDRHRAVSRYEQRVAVRRRLRHRVGADIAAGAAAVLDDERLTESLLQPLRKRAADDVRGRARRVRNDDPHGLRRDTACDRRARRTTEQDAEAATSRIRSSRFRRRAAARRAGAARRASPSSRAAARTPSGPGSPRTRR